MPALIHGTLVCDTCRAAINCTAELSTAFNTPKLWWKQLPASWRVYTTAQHQRVFCSGACDTLNIYNRDCQAGRVEVGPVPTVDPTIIDRIAALAATRDGVPSDDSVLEAIAALLKAIGK